MAGFFQIVGMVTAAAFVLFVTWLVFEITGNVYGGIKGAYRMQAIMRRDGRHLGSHRQLIHLGLKAWAGHRYRDGCGTYWQIGAMIVPVDGRDSIQRDRRHPRVQPLPRRPPRPNPPFLHKG